LQLTNKHHFSSDRDELAGAKLWTIYISEAEKYDKALLEGWKSDMQGLLIFVRGAEPHRSVYLTHRRRLGSSLQA
jgi:hypothetical protein